MESPEPQKAPEREEEVQPAHIWARAWSALKRGLRRRPRPSESPTDSPSTGVVQGGESEGVWKIARAVATGLAAVVAAYGGAVIIALGVAPFDLGNFAKLMAVLSAAGGVLLVASSWLGSAPDVRGVWRRASVLLMAEFGVLGVLGFVVGMAELVDIFT